MPTHQLQLEWQSQPIEVEDKLNKDLIIKDPLAIIAQPIGVPTPPREERVKYGSTSVENFWFLFQDLMKEEFKIFFFFFFFYSHLTLHSPTGMAGGPICTLTRGANYIRTKRNQ